MLFIFLTIFVTVSEKELKLLSFRLKSPPPQNTRLMVNALINEKKHSATEDYMHLLLFFFIRDSDQIRKIKTGKYLCFKYILHLNTTLYYNPI